MTASVSPFPKWTVYGIYIPGSFQSNGQSFVEYETGVRYAFATNATIVVKYRDLNIAGIEQEDVYRAQIDYSF